MPSIQELGKTYQYENCSQLISTVPTSDLRETELFVEGDHWQERSGWIGWTPSSKSENSVKNWNTIQETFNAENVIGGIVNRLRGATLGKMPDWKVVPKDREKAKETLKTRIEEIDKALNDWWTNKAIHDELKKFIEAKATCGKACLRIYIPKGYLEEDGKGYKLPASTLEDVLDKIYVKCHHYANYNDTVDSNFGEKVAVVRLKNDEAANEPDTSDTEYEVAFVDREKKTILRTVSANAAKSAGISLDLGGNNLIYIDGEYKDALISPTIKKQQKAVNHAKTGENYALANINFPETTFIDLNVPTEEVTVAGKTVKQDLIESGLGVFRKLFSRKVQNADGGEQVSKGEVIYRDGADPEKFAKVAENNKRSMHSEAGMLYIYLVDSEYASGDSKMESMTDYAILLADYTEIASRVGVWLFETVVRLALRFTNEQKMNKEFTVLFTPNLTLGRLSVEERNAMMQEVEMQLRSRRNYRIVAKVSDDPDAEQAEIVKEQKEMPTVPANANPNGNGNGNGAGKPAPAVTA